MIDRETNILGNRTIERASMFSKFQLKSGAVNEALVEIEDAQTVLMKTTSLYRSFCKHLGDNAIKALQVFEEDTEEWLSKGLNTQPDFRNTHAKWQPSSAPSDLVPFLAPLKIPNGQRGDSFVMNFALTSKREVIHEDIIQATTGTYSTDNRAIVAEATLRSNGYKIGDGSVLFSELLCSSLRKGPQTFGAFIISDFKEAYKQRTVNAEFTKGPILARILGEIDGDDLLDERTTWLYVHDYFHEVGSLPHSEFLQSKMHFPTAVLDELKADGKAYLSFRELDSNMSSVGIRHLVDKMFRFSSSQYAFSSVDGAVGELMFREAITRGALIQFGSGGLELAIDKLDICIMQLVEDVLKIEALSFNEDIYIKLANEYLAEKGLSLPPFRQPLRF